MINKGGLLLIMLLCAALSICLLLISCSTDHPVPVEQTIPYGYGIDENGELFKYIPQECEVVEIWA